MPRDGSSRSPAEPDAAERRPAAALHVAPVRLQRPRRGGPDRAIVLGLVIASAVGLAVVKPWADREPETAETSQSPTESAAADAERALSLDAATDDGAAARLIAATAPHDAWGIRALIDAAGSGDATALREHWEAVEPAMTIEPLRNLPVIRDLVVDRSPFEQKVAALEPWIERAVPYAGFPEKLTHRQMKDASKALDCIGCMCCYSACPVIGLGGLTDFAGPAPLVQLGQTALDPRNSKEKLARSLALTSIFSCISCYKCEEACPAAIPIVSRVIEPLKARAAELLPQMAIHSRAFRTIIAQRGRIDPGALVLRVQGVRALVNFSRIFRMLIRGKVNPLKTLLGIRTAASRPAQHLLGKGNNGS